MPRPTQKQIREATARLLEQDRQRERELRDIRDAIDDGTDPQTKTLIKNLTTHLAARRVVPDTPARLAGWGDDHGHAGVQARIDESLRRNRIANWHAERDSSGRGGDLDGLTAPPPEFVPVVAEHPRGGRMRLACDGSTWILRMRGAEFGCGDVQARERGHLEDGTPVYTPSAETLEAASQQALRAPGGPEQPVGTVWYSGGPDGEPIEHVVGEELYDPTADDGVIAGMRRKVAAWKEQLHD